MLKYISGDLIRDAFNYDVIGHGCNCFHTMGAGIAPQVKKRFPQAYEADKRTAFGDEDKLGTISVSYEYNPITHAFVFIVNCYTQFSSSSKSINEPAVDYNAVRNCMKELHKTFPNKKIGLPMIGAGLAGGDWDVISEIIKEELPTEDVEIVVWEKDYDNLKRVNLI